MKIKLLAYFIAIHAMAVALLIYWGFDLIALNLELAYFAAMLIMFASYQGYKKMVMSSVAHGVALEVQDPLDKIDDPYDLYDEEEPTKETTDLKELKKEIKKDGFKKMIKTAAGHTSWKRIGSYVLLILIFMGLNNNDALHIAGFLAGLTLGIISATILGPKMIGPQSGNNS